MQVAAPLDQPRRHVLFQPIEDAFIASPVRITHVCPVYRDDWHGSSYGVNRKTVPSGNSDEPPA